MLRRINSFISKDRGMGTVEIVIIVAVLVGIALIFRDAIIDFATDIMNSVFGDESITDAVGSSAIRQQNQIN
jgi:hypothetical protein